MKINSFLRAGGAIGVLLLAVSFFISGNAWSAAGDPVKAGQSVDAGSSMTVINSSSSTTTLASDNRGGGWGIIGSADFKAGVYGYSTYLNGGLFDGADGAGQIRLEADSSSLKATCFVGEIRSQMGSAPGFYYCDVTGWKKVQLVNP